jgi:hypothetical protein
MTKKTGSKTFKARQLMKAARAWRQLREMREAGVKLESPRPTKEEAKQKEEELEKLYLELTGAERKEEGPEGGTGQGQGEAGEAGGSAGQAGAEGTGGSEGQEPKEE